MRLVYIIKTSISDPFLCIYTNHVCKHSLHDCTGKAQAKKFIDHKIQYCQNETMLIFFALNKVCIVSCKTECAQGLHDKFFGDLNAVCLSNFP